MDHLWLMCPESLLEHPNQHGVLVARQEAPERDDQRREDESERGDRYRHDNVGETQRWS
jgi:hypothetical protein